MVLDVPHPPFRTLFFSPDSLGLGHLRRTLTLAEGFSRAFPRSEALILTGSPVATAFPLPPRVGLVKIPSVVEDESGRYVPHNQGGPLTALLSLRRRLALETYRGFRPDLIVVDHRPLGLGNELLPLLREARSDGTRSLLGLCDVVALPQAGLADEGEDEVRWALREGYDRLCVYGTAGVFDPRTDCVLPEGVAERLEFTGYVVRPDRPRNRRPVPALRPQVLVTVGGGVGGASLLSAYLEGISKRSVSWDTVVVAGPLFASDEARRIRRRARMIGNVEVRRFYADMPRLFAECDAVVSTGGYNTCAEALRSLKPWVVSPRRHPRSEQSVRARRLARLGLCLDLPEPRARSLRRAVAGALETVTMPRQARPALEGVEEVCRIAGDLLEIPSLLTDKKRGMLVS